MQIRVARKTTATPTAIAMTTSSLVTGAMRAAYSRSESRIRSRFGPCAHSSRARFFPANARVALAAASAMASTRSRWA